MFAGQSGLKAIEYHMDGGSDMAVQLSQGGQVHGEGGTRIVYVPVPGKRSYCLCMCDTVNTGSLFVLLKKQVRSLLHTVSATQTHTTCNLSHS